MDSTPNFTRRGKSSSPSDKLFSVHSLLASNKKAKRKPCVFCNLLNNFSFQRLKVSNQLQKNKQKGTFYVVMEVILFVPVMTIHILNVLANTFAKKCKEKHQISLCTS